jgi:hypothetical protein
MIAVAAAIKISIRRHREFTIRQTIQELLSKYPFQKSPTESPLLVVPIARHAFGSTLFVANRTDPSAIETLTSLG